MEGPMKIRIGVGAGDGASTPEVLAELVTAIDELGFDSLWLLEILTGAVIDPLVGLAWAAASNPAREARDDRTDAGPQRGPVGETVRKPRCAVPRAAAGDACARA